MKASDAVMNEDTRRLDLNDRKFHVLTKNKMYILEFTFRPGNL